MSFFLRFEEHQLFEKNRIRQYFEENPDKIKKFQGLEGQGIEFDVYDFAREIYYGENPIEPKWKEVLKKLTGLKNQLFANNMMDASVSSHNQIDDWDIFTNGKFIDFYGYDTKKIKSYEDFESVIKEFMSKYKKSFSQEQFDFVKANWNDFYKLTIEDNKLKILSNSWAYNKLKKEALNRGFKPEDFAKVISWMNYYTGMSRRLLPPSIWPAINALTVDVNTLPEYVYRGIFYDGAKIKDHEAFKKKWAKGNKPKEGLRKATSWSTSRKVAIEFMGDQDFIKDAKTGYHILLRLKVRPELVIADFRNIEWTRFWNQQEIVINPAAAKDYEVDEIIPYGETDFNNPSPGTYRDFERTNAAANASAHGWTKGDLMGMIFHLNSMDLDDAMITNWKIVKDMTVGEFEQASKKHISGWTTVKDNGKSIIYPLFEFIKMLWNVWPTEIISPSSVMCNMTIELSTASYSYNPKSPISKMLQDIFGAKDKQELESFQMPYGYRIFVPVKITLTQNNINKFVFDIEVSKEIKEDRSNEYSEKDKSNENVKIVYDAIVSKYLDTIKSFVENQILMVANRFNVIKIRIK